MNTAVVDYTREEPVVAGRPTASEIDAVVSAPVGRFDRFTTCWPAMGGTGAIVGTGIGAGGVPADSSSESGLVSAQRLC